MHKACVELQLLSSSRAPFLTGRKLSSQYSFKTPLQNSFIRLPIIWWQYMARNRTLYFTIHCYLIPHNCITTSTTIHFQNFNSLFLCGRTLKISLKRRNRMWRARRYEWTWYKSRADRRQHLTSCLLRGEDRDQVTMQPGDNPVSPFTFDTLWQSLPSKSKLISAVPAKYGRNELELSSHPCGVSVRVLSGHVSAEMGRVGFHACVCVLMGSAVPWPSGHTHSETPFGINYSTVMTSMDTCLNAHSSQTSTNQQARGREHTHNTRNRSDGSSVICGWT